jgi:D-glycero-alpha-D-manno-heptose 1-phosphate guanylyltransferase
VTSPSKSAEFSENIPAVLLVGGLGTRLQSVLPATAKPMARVGEAPFLELLVKQLRSQGIRRLIMCTGHLAEQVESEFGDGHKLNVSIVYSKESQPLGTAGAVKFAEHHIGQASDFLVMNGDSFLELNLDKLLRFHRERDALVTMALCKVQDAARYGSVETDSRNRVTGFREKTGVSAPGAINGGVYVFKKEVLDSIPGGPASLERDIFPKILTRGIYALEQPGMFIDIGTPEDYARAQDLSRSLNLAARADDRRSTILSE